MLAGTLGPDHTYVKPLVGVVVGANCKLVLVQVNTPPLTVIVGLVVLALTIAVSDAVQPFAGLVAVTVNVPIADVV